MAANADRFWSRLDKSGECWEWTGHRGPKGYGVLGFMGKLNVAAHRLAFRLAFGRWPTGLVCHHCDNRPCCNPAHLYEGDDFTNMRDKVLRTMTHCVRGHEFTPANTIPIGPEGKWRQCLTCAKTVMKERATIKARIRRAKARGRLDVAEREQERLAAIIAHDKATNRMGYGARDDN